MTFEIESKNKESTVDYIINTFKELLEKKELKPGDKIPSETELSQMFSASRGSVREALKILSAFGVVDIQRGNGSYISTGETADVINPILFGFLLMNPSEEEVIDFRACIERNVLLLAIKNANDEDIKKINENIIRFKNISPDEKDFKEKKLQLDLQFHSLLGKATHNGFIEKIYDFAMQYFVPSILRTYENQDAVPVKSVKSHEILFEPVLKKDNSLIENAVNESIKIWKSLSVTL